jgi:hypothetical protein
MFKKFPNVLEAKFYYCNNNPFYVSQFNPVYILNRSVIFQPSLITDLFPNPNSLCIHVPFYTINLSALVYVTQFADSVLFTQNASPDVVKVLAGNKSDATSQRAVAAERGEKVRICHS